MALNLLVALDESPCAEAAGQAAVTLAAALDREVLLTALHVVNVTGRTGRLLQDLAGLVGFEPVVVPEAAERIFLQRGRALIERYAVSVEAQGLECRRALDQGSVIERLVHHAAASDLLIAGARGETAVNYPGHRGMAERLAKRLPTPCLLVPEEGISLERVTLAYDGSEGARVALRVAGHIAEWSGCAIRVIYVDDGRQRAGDPLAEAKTYLEESHIEPELVALEGEAHEALAAAMAPREILVVGFRGRNWLRGLLLGRVTERLLDEPALALLIAR